MASSTPYADTGVPAGDPSWPLLPVRGRFTDPLHEQALLLSQANDCAGTGAAAPTRSSWARRRPARHAACPLAPAGAGPRRGEPGGRRRRRPGRPGRARRASPTTRSSSPTAAPTAPCRSTCSTTTPPRGRRWRRPPRWRCPPSAPRPPGPARSAWGWGTSTRTARTRSPSCGRAPGAPAAGARRASRCPTSPILRYTNTGRTRSLAVLQADVPLPAALLTGSPAPDMGFQMAVDDFDGQGRDLLAVSYVDQDAALAVLGFARGRRDLHRRPLRPRPRRLHRAGLLPGRAGAPPWPPARRPSSPPASSGTTRPAGTAWAGASWPWRRCSNWTPGSRRRRGAAGLRRRLRRLDLRPESGPVPADPDRPARADRGLPRAPGTPWPVRPGLRDGRRPSSAPTVSLAAGELPGAGPEPHGSEPGALGAGRRASPG